MTQHTPGPWYRDGYADDVVCSAIIRDATGFQVALTRHWGINEAEANARLIAAAPDLLKACRLMLEAVNEHHKDGSILWVSPGTTAWELLTNVIEKATGENLQKTT